jgi:peroxiredoxin
MTTKTNFTETLEIGSRAPAFRLKDANGSSTVTLAGLVAKGPVVLEFLRGTWCGSCRQRLLEVELVADEVRETGAQLVFIAAEKSEGMWHPRKFLKGYPISFPFLLDEDCSVTQAYGLFHRIAIDAWKIARPATLIVPSEGRIRYIFRGANQMERSPIESVIRRLNRLNAPAQSLVATAGRS